MNLAKACSSRTQFCPKANFRHISCAFVGSHVPARSYLWFEHIYFVPSCRFIGFDFDRAFAMEAYDPPPITPPIKQGRRLCCGSGQLLAVDPACCWCFQMSKTYMFYPQLIFHLPTQPLNMNNCVQRRAALQRNLGPHIGQYLEL